MNDLPLSDASFMRKEFWDRQGANIASCCKEMYGEKLFWRQKTPIFEGFGPFFAAILSEMDLDHIGTWGV